MLLSGCGSPRGSFADRHKPTPTPTPAPAPQPPPLNIQGDGALSQDAVPGSAPRPLTAEEVVADEVNVPSEAQGLKVGMTLGEARAVFLPHPLKLESRAEGPHGTVSVYRTLLVSRAPEVWLTFFGDSLQSWTVVARH